MKRRLILFALLAGGCTETVSRDQLLTIRGQETYAAMCDPKARVPVYAYTGQDGQYQYVRRDRPGLFGSESRSFRVPVGEDLGFEPMPKTSDRTRWQPLVETEHAAEAISRP